MRNVEANKGYGHFLGQVAAVNQQRSKKRLSKTSSEITVQEMNATQKSFLPQEDMLSRLASAAQKIHASRVSAANPAILSARVSSGRATIDKAVSALTKVSSGLDRSQREKSQGIFRRMVEDRRRRLLSREVVRIMRWLEDLVVRSKGTGPGAAGARHRLKELDTDTRLFITLQSKSKAVGMGDEGQSLVTRVYDAIEQAFPRQRQYTATQREAAQLELEKSFDHKVGSLGI